MRIVTLDNAIFGDRKNDLAFMIEDKFIILIEMQSTVNPNMPLRFLVYIAKQFEKLFFSSDIYSKTHVKVPTPEIYVFYNGSEDLPLESELKLSDAFTEKCDKLYLDLTVRVINVNYEKGAELLKRCRTLSEYSQLVYIAKQNYERTHDLDTAVTEAVRECVRKNILADFLKENGGDVMSFLYDMLTKEEMEEIREHDGYVRGLAEGKSEEKQSVALNMLAKGLGNDFISECTGLTEDEIDELRQ